MGSLKTAIQGGILKSAKDQKTKDELQEAFSNVGTKGLKGAFESIKAAAKYSADAPYREAEEWNKKELARWQEEQATRQQSSDEGLAGMPSSPNGIGRPETLGQRRKKLGG